MTISALFGFSTAMVVLASSPGPGVFATVSLALASGTRATLPLICGIVLGDIIYLLFAVFGLSVLARTMGDFFFIIKLLGGLYLIWIGLQIWRTEPEHILPKKPAAATGWKSFLSGLAITLSNPKVIIFYCGFLPGFIDLSALTTMEIFLIATLVTTLLFSVLFSYSLAAGKTRGFFSSRRSIQCLNKTAGTIMAVTGLAIATRS